MPRQETARHPRVCPGIRCADWSGSLRQTAAETAGLITALGVGPVNVVGLSLGVEQDHLVTGLGPLINPVPAQRGRGGDRPRSHRSPISSGERSARAPYRQRHPGLPLGALPDAVFDEFFVSLSSNTLD